MTDLLELAEKAWNGELDIMFEHHPVHSFYKGSTELDKDLLGIKGIAGFYIIDTGDGLVMLDAGSVLDVERAFVEVRNWRPETPLVAAIFTHHHVDHIFSTKLFEKEALDRGWAKPQIYGHSLMPDHFDRYLNTLGWNTAINRRQFAINVPKFRWPDHYRYPDKTYSEEMNFKKGNLSFELHHARGETDDHTWVFIPERKILVTGDLFIWAVPNAGNPQKVQRYVSDWANALEKMISCEAETMLPGHGFPIFGKERIKEALSTTAEFLCDVERQTLLLMNKGLSLNAILKRVRFSKKLMGKPWLKPVYDDPKFLVRMIWRRYGGWWDGEYDRLLSETREKESQEWVKLAGGIKKVCDRALELSNQGKHSLACHLIETAMYHEPENHEMHKIRTIIYKEYSKQQTSSMARNILNHASLASLEGKRDLTEDS